MKSPTGRARVDGREQGTWVGQGWLQGAEHPQPRNKSVHLIFRGGHPLCVTAQDSPPPHSWRSPASSPYRPSPLAAHPNRREWRSLRKCKCHQIWWLPCPPREDTVDPASCGNALASLLLMCCLHLSLPSATFLQTVRPRACPRHLIFLPSCYSVRCPRGL